MTSDSTPAFEIEKEALKTEIETGIQAGVDHLEAKTAKRKDADKYHNTRHLLKQYRKVANQSTGTKMPRADWKLVSKTVFSIPSNISEQAAIGTYFTALDSLITLHQRQTIVYAVIRSIRKVILAERQYFAPPMVRKSP